MAPFMSALGLSRISRRWQRRTMWQNAPGRRSLGDDIVASFSRWTRALLRPRPDIDVPAKWSEIFFTRAQDAVDYALLSTNAGWPRHPAGPVGSPLGRGRARAASEVPSGQHERPEGVGFQRPSVGSSCLTGLHDASDPTIDQAKTGIGPVTAAPEHIAWLERDLGFHPRKRRHGILLRATHDGQPPDATSTRKPAGIPTIATHTCACRPSGSRGTRGSRPTAPVSYPRRGPRWQRHHRASVAS
jgi:hypothetical protein